jgi:histidyl-tRNA synthetase
MKLMLHCGGGSFKSQFKKADKSGAQVALVIGDNEAEQGVANIKWLREEKPQQTLAFAELSPLLGELLDA